LVPCSTASDFGILTCQRIWKLTRLVGISQPGSTFLVEVFGGLHLAPASRRVCIQAEFAIAVRAFLLYILRGVQQHLICSRSFGEQWSRVFKEYVLLVVFFA